MRLHSGRASRSDVRSRTTFRRACLFFFFIPALCTFARAQGETKRVSVAVLDMGATATAARASERVSRLLVESRAPVRLALLDRDMRSEEHTSELQSRQ